MMQNAERTSKREALISLLRGEVSCPLLSAQVLGVVLSGAILLQTWWYRRK